jgi:hypothetical protein
VADVIARHYLDALDAIPGDPDAVQIRGQAIAALIRSARRAERTGAPALAAGSYAAAAELSTAARHETADGQPDAGDLWEHAAQAAGKSANWAMAVEHAGRARDYHLDRGQARAAARARAIAGEALHGWGHYAEAREQLNAAADVLRAEPDTDTVRALESLATVEVFAGSAEAGTLTTEALILGQLLDVGAGQLSGLFTTRGIYLIFAGRRPESVAYLRESARLATQAGDNFRLGRALLNLSVPLWITDAAAAAEAARTAAGHLRLIGDRDALPFAIFNLAAYLLWLGDWDAAGTELAQAMDSGGLADADVLACQRAWLAGMRGDTATAETMLAALTDMRASEDPQAKAWINLAEAFTAAARRQPENALSHARAVLARTDASGMINDDVCWAWALAARAAGDPGDTATARELIAPLDSYQPGRLAPMLRAERNLARARLAASDTNPAADASFASAIGAPRELSTPCHLAHGLLDHARHLLRRRDTEAAEAAIGEARDIARNLRCQPLLDRAATITPAKIPDTGPERGATHLEDSPAAAKVTPASGADHNRQGHAQINRFGASSPPSKPRG